MPASEEFDTRPVRAFLPGPDVHVDELVWPASVPAMAQLLREGLELPVGHAALGLGRPESGHRMAAFHARPAFVFPASVRRVMTP
jgi:hypothetical protein